MCARWRLPLPSAGGAVDAGRKEGEGGGNAAVDAAVDAAVEGMEYTLYYRLSAADSSIVIVIDYSIFRTQFWVR